MIMAPDRYLDHRLSGWQLYEKLGKIKYDEFTRLVTVDDDLTFVVSALST